MKKIIGTTLIATLLAGTAATAQQIAPLDTTASTQAGTLPILTTIPAGAIVVGGFVVLAGVIIGLASDGT
ncbi:hypothetical protein [Roseicyclus persicicus]|uniref:Ferrochelatase n=1 Tax=Roseicyclus persicicus TaxID=2650661 RepID=A0A7X6JWM1_9RHOB|nr:hypothetical protein [Roseibacterium persicicum]NKX43830.1 hypothetical protein [Roseibacterium persicicum]